jgi:hypothetical protein
MLRKVSITVKKVHHHHQQQQQQQHQLLQAHDVKSAKKNAVDLDPSD